MLIPSQESRLTEIKNRTWQTVALAVRGPGIPAFRCRNVNPTGARATRVGGQALFGVLCPGRSRSLRHAHGSAHETRAAPEQTAIPQGPIGSIRRGQHIVAGMSIDSCVKWPGRCLSRCDCTKRRVSNMPPGAGGGDRSLPVRFQSIHESGKRDGTSRVVPTAFVRVVGKRQEKV